MTTAQPSTKGIIQAKKNLEGISELTPLKLNQILSDETNAKIYLKREDLQVVRSYKIRGAYNFISQLSAPEKNKVWCVLRQVIMRKVLPILVSC